MSASIARARPAVRRLRNPPRAPWPGRYGWVASDADVILAQHAAFELAAQRCEIQLVPVDPTDQRNRYGRKLRVCVSTTPRWYQTLFYRRPQGCRPSVRAYVVAALASIIATRYLRPDQNRRQPSMDLEVLAVLYGHFDPGAFGYPNWDGGLRLRRNCWAERQRGVQWKRRGWKAAH